MKWNEEKSRSLNEVNVFEGLKYKKIHPADFRACLLNQIFIHV